MSSAVKIQSFIKVEPMIYAYNTPGVDYHIGWIKIGYTDKQTPEQRIEQQTHTADIRYKLLWKNFARYTDGSGESFKDTEFHTFLEVNKSIERKKSNGKKKEWFKIDADTSLKYFVEFAARGTKNEYKQKLSYILRDEQEEAVAKTKAYFENDENGVKKFLWNAKPRFGKTLAAYDLIRRMKLSNVLIVTNRPSIANSWADDFEKFIEWHEGYYFVSDTETLAENSSVISRQEYLSRTNSKHRGMIAFESLQGLKGSVYFGGKFDKLEWIAKEYTDNSGEKHHGIDFDLLIIDEAQEGIETIRTESAFDNISRKYTLYLSGTPFKQLASPQFSASQIFNWTYADEQERKNNWTGEGYNPYEPFPRLAMFTYRMSEMIRERIGNNDSGPAESTDYAFDLNEFFATNETGKFIHEAEVKKFLHALTTQEKYPFSTPELRKELSHTLWYLNRVQSVEALDKLLKNDPVFKEYKVVKVVGDGSSNETDKDSIVKNNYKRVEKAINEYDKTITLTVGQLTVGVTVPKWSGVLMLCNLKSPSSYIQAAFRVQNPCMYSVNGKTFQKETAYIFDFDPARTLVIFDDFANKLKAETANGSVTSEDRKANIRKLLNFFPVLGEDDEGRMVELDAEKVLAIPKKLKCQEVVRSRFMCNYLFDVGTIFGAPTAIKDIIERLQTALEDKRKPNQEALDNLGNTFVGEDGEAKVPYETIVGLNQHYFADKKYEEISTIQRQADALLQESSANYDCSSVLKNNLIKIADSLKSAVKESVSPVMDDYNPKPAIKKRIERQIDDDIDSIFDKIANDYKREEAIARKEHDLRLQEAQTEDQVKEADDALKDRMQSVNKATFEEANKQIECTINEKPIEVIKRLEQNKAEIEKRETEEEISAHLRGFFRTFPSLIMAYGDEDMTLANFEDYIEDTVFQEVTGISKDDFRFLRDGGNRLNPETGELESWKSSLFEETVFNDSIKEFLKKKQELADYLNNDRSDTIFDYIPPLETNKIFTPKWVVKMMVDELEKNNPGCFDDPTKTFADLYMKSGLFIAEIIKRLYKSEAMKTAFPDDKDRIKHILQKQVYGMAPTRIIYLIAKNYILGCNDMFKNISHNFVEANAAEAAKDGKLTELVNKKFGVTT